MLPDVHTVTTWGWAPSDQEQWSRVFLGTHSPNKMGMLFRLEGLGGGRGGCLAGRGAEVGEEGIAVSSPRAGGSMWETSPDGDGRFSKQEGVVSEQRGGLGSRAGLVPVELKGRMGATMEVGLMLPPGDCAGGSLDCAGEGFVSLLGGMRACLGKGSFGVSRGNLASRIWRPALNSTEQGGSSV